MEIKLQPGGYYKLKVSLENLPYTCTRKILVPWNITMEQLHYVIQIAMGWEMEHLYQFVDTRAGKHSISLVHDEGESANDVRVPEKKAADFRLKEEFAENRDFQPFWYRYDFGDEWWHQITFIKSNQADLKLFKGVPLCVAGKGTCPPENSGGPEGFAYYLEVLKGPPSMEKSDIKEWLEMASDEEFDEDWVEIEDINEELDVYYHSIEWEEGFDFEEF